MFEGRSIDSKKHLIRLLFERIQAEIGISAQDIEVTISETPANSEPNQNTSGCPFDSLRSLRAGWIRTHLR